MNDNNKPNCEAPKELRIREISNSLKDLAIYLSGVKDGKGNLLPLGTIVLNDLWEAIKILRSHE